MAQLQEQLQIEVSVVGKVREDFDRIIRDAERASEQLADIFEKNSASAAFLGIRKQAEDSYSAIVKGAKSARDQIDRSLSGGSTDSPAAKSLAAITREAARVDPAVGQASRSITQLGQSVASTFGPAGRTVGGVVSELSELTGGLDAVIAKSGISAAALGGIGLAVGAVGSIAFALNEAADASERLDSRLVGLAALTRDYAQASADAKFFARKTSNESGLPADTVAEAQVAASPFFRASKDQEALVRSVVPATIAGQIDLKQGAGDLARVLATFNRPASEAASIMNKLFVASRESGAGMEALLNSTARLALQAKDLGLTFEDTLGVIAAAAKNKVPVDDVAGSLQRLLSIINDTGNGGRKALAALGVDFDVAGKGAAGLVNLFSQIKSKTAELGPTGLQSAIGGSGASRSVLAALQADPGGLLAIQNAIGTDLRALDNAALQVGNDAGSRLAKKQQEVANFFSSIGDGFQEFKATLAGSDIKFPEIDVSLPPELGTLSARVADAISVGNTELAKATVEQMRALGARSGEAFTQALDAAVQQQAERNTRRAEDIANKFLEPGESRQVFSVDLERKRLASTFQAPTNLEKFRSQIQEVIDRSAAAVAGVEASIKLEVKPALATDRLSSDIDRALAQLQLQPVELPISVQAAKAELERIQKLRTIDGVKTGSDVINQQGETNKAQASVQAVKEYFQAESQLRGIIAQVGAKSSSGFDAQIAQARALESAVKESIDRIRESGSASADTLSKADAALESFKQANSGRLEEIASKNVATVQSQILALRVQSLEKAREIARAQGDTVNVDRLGVEIIEARARAQESANALALDGLSKQYEGQKDIQGSLRTLGFLMGEQVSAARVLAGLEERRSAAERARVLSDRLGSLRGETLIGLDAELEKINRNRRAREAADRRDIKSGALVIPQSDFDRVLAFYDQVEQRDIALARRNSTLGIVDGLAQSLGQVTGELRAQVVAINLGREAERLRLEDSLRASGASLEVQGEQIRLFDELTAKQREAAVVGFAGQSSAAIAETRLLADAYRDAAQASKLLGETRERALEREVAAVSRAREGARALAEGYRAGTNDALRSLNDLDFGVEAGRNRVIGFRDSIVEALDSVGEKGKSVGDILRGVVVGNLRNLQREFATKAANSLTKAVFGEAKPNEAAASPLDASAFKLQTAGDQLLLAARSLDQAALTANGRAYNALPPELQSAGRASFVFQGPGVDGNPLGGESPQQGPNPDGSTADGAAALNDAGSAAGSALTAGAPRAAASLVQGGQGFLASFLGGAGDKLGGFLTDGILAGLGVQAPTKKFATGGVFGGIPIRASPLANRLGGKYTQRTLIEVAEVPGLQEAVIPLQGGAVPVQLRGNPGRDVARERAQRAVDARPAPERETRSRGGRGGDAGRTTDVRVNHAPTINLGGITVQVTGSAGNDPQAIAKEVGAQVQKQITAALNSGSDRRLIEAVRGAVR